MDRTARDPREPSAQIEIEHVMPGADIITVGQQQIALGFPEEVVKAWQRAGRKPTAWLIPDRRAAHGIVQWALEFPLYYALFVQGLFARKARIPVLAHAGDWKDVVEYLRLSLLGLTREELAAEGVKKAVIDTLVPEMEHLALKGADGRPARIEEFLEPLLFDDEGIAKLGELTVKSHGGNTYSFFAGQDRLEEYRLELPETIEPPYSSPLAPASAPSLPQPFEVVALGTGTGFDPSGPCTSLLIQANGRSILVDSGPYIRTLLDHCGVSLHQVSALVLTHAHEDHCVGMYALLASTHRIRLFATRETVAIMRRKLAILDPGVIDPRQLIEDAFDVVMVEPGQAYDFFGLDLRFHYTMHSIPCTGVEFIMGAGASQHRVMIVGDHNSRANVERAGGKVLGETRLAQLRALYSWQGDLLVHDAGEGQIHGAPADFSDNRSGTLACVHTSAINPKERHLFSLARPGHRYTIVPENGRPTAIERGIAHRALTEAFGDASPEWVNALLDSAEATSVNRGQIVIRVRDRSQDLFVALTGELAVLAEQNGAPGVVAKIQAGEVFGEMAVVKGAPRSASVQAVTPSRLLRIPGTVFARFVDEAGLKETLPAVWGNRADLQRVGLFATATITARNALARQAVRRSVEPGSTLIREGSRSNTVYVLVKGRVQVYKGDEPLLLSGIPVIVEPGSLIGESAPLLEQTRNASLVALDDCEVLAIRGPDFRRIVRSSPHLFCAVSRIVRERCAA